MVGAGKEQEGLGAQEPRAHLWANSMPRQCLCVHTTLLERLCQRERGCDANELSNSPIEPILQTS